MGDEPDRKKLGDYIRAVMQDIIKEDIDEVNSFGFEIKDIGSKVAGQVKGYFFEIEKL
jgi:hypothetical protein